MSAGGKGRLKRLWPIPAIAVAALMPWLPGMPAFWITLLNYTGISAIVAIGLVVLTGIGGMTSFGQATILGLGAYTTAVLSTSYGISPWLGLPAGLAITACGALILGAVTVRRRWLLGALMNGGYTGVQQSTSSPS